MKRITQLVAVAALLLIGTGCDELITDLTTPNVTATAISNGTELRLNWAPVTDAEGYKIEVDGTVYTTTATTYDVTSPAKSISVLAYSGSSESNKWTMDLTAVVTQSLEVWGMSEPSPDRPSGFGFTSDGQAVSYAVGEAANHPRLEFIMEDRGMAMHFYSPNRYEPPFNTKDNGIAVAAGTDFDAAINATGDFYTAHPCVENAVYYFWLDPNANGWDLNDNFGKIKVVSVQGNKVTLKLAYQKVPGLTWVKTN